jgi:hypothetical protein
MSAGQDLIDAAHAADHLLLGVADLDSGSTFVDRLTGIRPAFGGSHPGRGTRNALVSLGARQYLEIIAPDPAQTDYTFQIDVRTLKSPKLITWAAASPDLDALAAKVRASGAQVFGPTEGSRARPDGGVLKWRSLGVASTFARDGVEPIPFFIQWAPGSPHPSQDSPKGCELQSLEIAHPDPAGVAGLLKQLGIDGRVKQADKAILRATLKTPRGPVYLS